MVLGAQLAAKAVRDGRAALAVRGAAIVWRQYWNQLISRAALGTDDGTGEGVPKDQSALGVATPLGQPLDWADHTFNAVRCAWRPYSEKGSVK